MSLPQSLPAGSRSALFGALRRQLSVLLGGAAAVLILAGCAAGVAKYVYQRDVAQASIEVRRLSYVITDHLERSTKSVQQSVARVVERLQTAKVDGVEALQRAATEPGFGAFVDEIVANNPFIAGLFVVSADGRLDERSRLGALDAERIARTGYMNELRNAKPGELVVSAPFQRDKFRTWMINVSLRVSAPEGAFVGGVSAIIDLSALARVLEQAPLGGAGAISIFRNDGAILAWVPKPELPFGANVKDTGIYRDFLSQRKDGVGREPGDLDDIERLYAVAQTPGLPLATVVSMASADVVADWVHEIRALAGATLVASLLIAAITLWLALRIDRVARERERQLQERQAAEQARTLASAINNVSHGVAMFDEKNRLLVWNPRYAEMFGFANGALRAGMSHAEMLAQKGLNALGRQVDPAARLGDALVYNTEMDDGRIIQVHKKSAPGGGVVFVHEDISERLRQTQQIEEMTTRDALTGLLNRPSFGDHLDLAVAEARRGVARYAVICIDLDKFSAVNDAFGHHVGDELLRRVAERIKAQVRNGDVIARLGGDEFAIIQRVKSIPMDSMNLAQRLQASIAKPLAIEGASVGVTCSIGIALAPSDAKEPAEILRLAELARATSKQKGGALYNFYSREMDETARRRRELEEDLRAAIALGQFELHYQPIVSLSDRSIQSYEALIRWRHPKQGFVSPGEFIPLAEETGLIVKIGEWVLKAAARHAAQLPARLKVAVNISPAQFRAPGFLNSIKAAVTEAGVEASRLIVEITEGVMVKDVHQAIETLSALRDMGVATALDDFGTGYSSLSYLHKLKFDRLKIDRSFVMSIGKDDSAEAIVRATLAMAHALKMETVAEGVETEDQFAFLSQAGCDHAQGYLIGRPAPAEEAASRRESRPVPAADQLELETPRLATESAADDVGERSVFLARNGSALRAVKAGSR